LLDHQDASSLVNHRIGFARGPYVIAVLVIEWMTIDQ